MKIKNISRLVTAVSFIVTSLSFVTLDQINSVIPVEYQLWTPLVIAFISYLASQLSEEKRVVVAKDNTVINSDGGSDEEGI
jgi:HPt (histidine-containing phosphotransfer) domain-containing protein